MKIEKEIEILKILWKEKLIAKLLLLYLIVHDVKQERKNNMHNRL